MLGFLQKSEANTAAAVTALAAQGRYREAILAGAALVRSGRAHEVERLLPHWRNRAFFERPHSVGKVQWPSPLPDPFPGLIDQIPEIAAHDATADLIGGAIQHHGSIIVRGLIDEDRAVALRADVDRAFATREAAQNSSETDGAWFTALRPNDDPDLALSRGFGGATTFLYADAPRFLEMWTDELKARGVWRLVEEHLGEPPCLSARKANLYRVPHNTGTAWHQDGAFLGPEVRTVNLWVSLSDCGDDAPGLEIVPWRIDEILPAGTHGAMFDWSVGNGLADELAAGRPFAMPVFKPGDAMFFDHKSLHRTGVTPTMTKARYAIETWMFAPSHYGEGTPLFI